MQSCGVVTPGPELRRRATSVAHGDEGGPTASAPHNFACSRIARSPAASRAFFRSAKAVTGMVPDRVTTDGHDSYPRAIRTELGKGVRHRASRYKNNALEQDHRGLKGRYRPMRSLKCPRSTAPPPPHHDRARRPRSCIAPRTSPCLREHKLYSPARELTEPPQGDRLGLSLSLHLAGRLLHRALGAPSRAWPACHHSRRHRHVPAAATRTPQADR